MNTEFGPDGDIELTYIDNDGYLSGCGTSTGSDVDAWCDSATITGVTITNVCNRVTVNFDWFTSPEMTFQCRYCYFELLDEFGASKAYLNYEICDYYDSRPIRLKIAMSIASLGDGSTEAA